MSAAPVTANPFGRDNAQQTRWLFEGWRVTTQKDGTERHVLVRCSVVRQNHHDAAKVVSVRLGCEPGELKLVDSKVFVGPVHAYIAHRLSAKTKRGMDSNRARASRWVAWAARQGYAPHATWIPLSSQWEETAENRALGLELDKSEIALCDILLQCGQRGDPERSSGMTIEREFAESVGIEVRDVTTLDGEPPK